jgi:hypothetical protein
MNQAMSLWFMMDISRVHGGYEPTCGGKSFLPSIYIYYDTQQIFFLETWFGIEYHHDMLLYDIVCSFWGPVCGGL